MKLAKNILLGVLGVCTFSCSNEYKGVFEKTPDERMSELVSKYTTVLQEAEYGWMGHYYSNPGKLGAYTMVFKFGKEGTYKMNWSVRDQLDEGTYSTKSIEKPLISFDTYTNFTKFADPSLMMDGEVEFSILGVSQSGDTVFMEERIKKSPFNLVKCNSTDWENLKLFNTQTKHIIRESESVVRPFYYNLKVDGWKNEMTFVYYDNRTLAKVFYIENGKYKEIQMGINFTADGFEFMSPIGMDGIFVRSFTYDADRDVHRVADAGVKGEFYYATSVDFTIEGAAQRYFGKGKFGSNSRYESVSFHNQFDDVTPHKFVDFAYDSYGGWFSSFKWQFSNGEKDEAGYDLSYTIRGENSTYELIGPNTVRINCTVFTSLEYTQEEVDAYLSSKKGMALKNIFFSEKGWTIIPFYEDPTNEYSKNIYLVNNEDPTIYFTFGEIAEEEEE